MGKRLAMQCHVEMTEEMVEKWINYWQSEVEESQSSPIVQSEQEILENLT